ncbi:MAG: Spy/CpxP family protein refolding chaperone [Methyloceanibacter sp.]|nr:Spy/CpxP family protein refolding chaperone [Methyloceanibacter sp.]
MMNYLTRSIVRAAAVFAVVGAMLVPAVVSAQSLTPEEVAKLETRLNLTPEQRTAIDPILRASMSQRQSTFRKHGVDLQTCTRPGALRLIRLNKDMNRINADTRSRLAAVLSAAQLREYDKIVAEQTAIVKKQIMC